MSTSNISASLLSSVPKLNGDNYYDWKFAITQVLRFTGCLSVVTTDERPSLRDKTAEWDRISEQGLTIIGLTVEPSQYVYIRDAKTASAAWTALQGQYQKNSRANRIALKRQLYGTKQELSAPIREYTSRILDTAARLRSIGVSLKDEDIVDALIFNLHPDWSNIATSLSTTQGKLKIADVTSALEDEESRRTLDTDNSASPYSAHAARAPSTSTATARGRTPLTHITCYNCGVKGHYQQQCDKPLKPFRERAAIAFATTDIAAADEEWISSSSI